MESFSNYIELINIKKTYGIDIALDIDYYKIPLDGIVTIVGFSGNGKTTLLNIISLLDTPDSNQDAKLIYKIDDEKYEITFEKNKINILNNQKKIDLDDFRRDLLSFVFQENMLHPSLSTESNIVMPLRASGKDYASDMDDLFEDIGLNKINNKSGGQKQRTAILRAMIKKSHIVFADEPTSSLDKPRAIQTLNTLKNTNTIWVTHDMLLAKEFSKYIIVVERGKLCELTKNSDDLDILHKLENGCSSKDVKKLPSIDIGQHKESSFIKKFSFIYEYAHNDLRKPFKDFFVLLFIAIFSFLSILLIHKISYSLDIIIKDKLNDPRVSYIQVVSDFAVNEFDEKDFETLKQSLKENKKLIGKCDVYKLKGYPNIKFKKKNGKFCTVSVGTFEKGSKLFAKMNADNDFNTTIDINKKPKNNAPLTIEDTLNFAIIGKDTRFQNDIENQTITKLGETDTEVSLIYAKDKLPLEQDIFVRDEFFKHILNNKEVKDYSIMFYPKDIKTSLALLEWLKENKNNLNIIEKKFTITDETDKYNSLKLITTIENIISVIMNVILVVILALLVSVAFLNIHSNTKNKHKELGIMLSFGMPKRYFFAFYFLKAILLSIVTIAISAILFYIIDIYWLNPYLKHELFKNILAIAKSNADNIISISLPIINQVTIFAYGVALILVLFLFTISLEIFKTPAKLIKE